MEEQNSAINKITSQIYPLDEKNSYISVELN